MTRLAHASEVVDNVGNIWIRKLPERLDMMDWNRGPNVSMTHGASPSVSQYRLLPRINPSATAIRFDAANIKRRKYSASFLGNEFIGTGSIAEPAHLIPARMLSRLPWGSFKILGAVRALVFDILHISPSFSWPYLAFVWSRKSKSIFVSNGVRPIISAVFGRPLPMTPFAAKAGIGHPVVRYQILDSALRACLVWHATKITNKRYHGGSMSIAIAQPRLFDAPVNEPGAQLSID